MNGSPELKPHVNASGLMLSDDLIFFSRVAAVARSQGLTVRQVKSMADLLEAARKYPPGGVIVDLQNPGLELRSLLEGLQSTSASMPFVAAYGSHVEAATLHAARAEGCDRVMPRSLFVELLEGSLASWLGAAAAGRDEPS
jgi:ActR/RegA family two-component response regulator